MEGGESFITYPFGLFSSIIVDTITGGDDSLKTVFKWSLIINLFYIPGTVVGALLVDWLKVRGAPSLARPRRSDPGLTPSQPKRQLIIFLCLQGAVGFIMSGA